MGYLRNLNPGRTKTFETRKYFIFFYALIIIMPNYIKIMRTRKKEIFSSFEGFEPTQNHNFKLPPFYLIHCFYCLNLVPRHKYETVRYLATKLINSHTVLSINLIFKGCMPSQIVT